MPVSTRLGVMASSAQLHTKAVFLSDHVSVRIELCGVIVELPRKSKFTSGFWSSEHFVKLFICMLTSTQS